VEEVPLPEERLFPVTVDDAPRFVVPVYLELFCDEGLVYTGLSCDDCLIVGVVVADLDVTVVLDVPVLLYDSFVP
jgi:hypothetical protein